MYVEIVFSVKSIGKKHRDSRLVNKADCVAVPQFPFPENPEPVDGEKRTGCFA